MLTDIERRMLEAGRFHIDGWVRPEARKAVAHLEKLGYITTFEGGSHQYTSINCTVTDAGRLALKENK